jgi:hypothetical protein
MYGKNFERKFLSLKEKFDSHIQEIQNNVKLYLKKKTQFSSIDLFIFRILQNNNRFCCIFISV